MMMMMAAKLSQYKNLISPVGFFSVNEERILVPEIPTPRHTYLIPLKREG